MNLNESKPENNAREHEDAHRDNESTRNNEFAEHSEEETAEEQTEEQAGEQLEESSIMGTQTVEAFLNTFDDLVNEKIAAVYPVIPAARNLSEEQDIMVGAVVTPPEKQNVAAYFDDFANRKADSCLVSPAPTAAAAAAAAAVVDLNQPSQPKQSVASFVQSFTDRKAGICKTTADVPAIAAQESTTAIQDLKDFEEKVMATTAPAKEGMASTTNELIGEHSRENIINNIQPLPMPVLRSSAGSRGVMIPGAHAIGGPPRGFRLRSSSTTSGAQSISSEGNTMASTITGALEASLVEDEEANVHELDLEASLEESTEEHQDRMEIIEGKALDEDTPRRSKSNIVVWIILALLAAATVAAISGTVIFMRSDDSPRVVDTRDTDRDPNQPLSLEFHEGLRPTTHDALLDPLSPQSRAYHWMRHDPHVDTYPVWRQLMRFGMVTWYYALNGEHWRINEDWLSYTVPECSWAMEPVPDYPGPCNAEGKLEVANQPHNNLSGMIPPECRLLKRLKYVDVGYNNITGELPVLGSGGYLEVMVVSQNNLQGLMKAEGGLKTKLNPLRILKMDGNQFRQHNGDSYMLFPELEIVNMSSNLLVDDFPWQLMYAKNLTYLGLADNQYYGTIPTHFGTLPNLKEMDISGNIDLVGSLPSELGLLSHLTSLDVSGTSLESPFPQQVCALQEGSLAFLRGNCTFEPQGCCQP